jgi:hypothetical protein
MWHMKRIHIGPHIRRDSFLAEAIDLSQIGFGMVMNSGTIVAATMD